MAHDPVTNPAPLLPGRTDQDEPSVFLPANLLREARRQRSLPNGSVPRICVLDPDGDIVRYIRETGRAVRSPVWARNHTEMWETTVDALRIEIIGNAVGAPFASTGRATLISHRPHGSTPTRPSSTERRTRSAAPAPAPDKG